MAGSAFWAEGRRRATRQEFKSYRCAPLLGIVPCCVASRMLFPLWTNFEAHIDWPSPGRRLQLTDVREARTDRLICGLGLPSVASMPCLSPFCMEMRQFKTSSCGLHAE